MEKKLKLTTRNIPRYLKGFDVFKNSTIGRVHEIVEYTNVNYIFAIELKACRYNKVYVKQAFDYIKVNPDFPAPINRQYYEYLSINYLRKFWKNRIPDVIHYDKKNDVLILSDIGKGAKLLADEIKNGRLHLNIVIDIGALMAQLHSATFGKSDYPVRKKVADSEHINFIFDFRLRGAREISPKDTNKLFNESSCARKSMIYGDWASKNVLVVGDKVRIVDFENVTRFDPAFDIGYALAHWVLEINKRNKSMIKEFLEEFEKSYQKEFGNQKVSGEIFVRSSKYIGAMMLHRLAGIKNTNRIEEYLSRGVDLIGIARKLLREDYSCPSEAVGNIHLNTFSR